MQHITQIYRHTHGWTNRYISRERSRRKYWDLYGTNETKNIFHRVIMYVCVLSGCTAQRKQESNTPR